MSVELAVARDGRPQEVHRFDDPPARILVGRNEECDVVLDDPAVSRHHCELLLEPGFYRIADLSSSSGTFVNGRRTSEGSLSSGDVITVGCFQLAYRAELPEAPASAPPPRERALGLPTLDAPVEAAAGGQALARVRGHLVREGDGGGRTFLLQATTFVIGAAPTAQLRLRGWRAPRVAALVLRDRNRFLVWDTSPKGKALRVNGQRVREAELRHGDLIEVLGERLRFRQGLPTLDPAGDVREQREILRQSGRQSTRQSGASGRRAGA